MACRQYVLESSCKRTNCKYIHDYLYCNKTSPNCRGNSCTQFHLNEIEMQELKNFVRPFTENVTVETDRVAYAIKSHVPRDCIAMVCVRYLIGKFCHWKNFPCKFCFRALSNTAFETMTWMRCQYCFLPVPEQALSNCGHLYHTACLDKLPLNVSGALPLYKCIVCDDESHIHCYSRVFCDISESDADSDGEGN